MYRHILLAVDLAEPKNQRKAIEAAVKLAQTFGSRLHVITVVPDFGMSFVADFFPKEQEKQALEHARQALRRFTREQVPEGVSVQHIVGHGTAYEEILRYAATAACDLIVLASHRPELKDYLLGPNAARVVRHANCSVLVVRD